MGDEEKYVARLGASMEHAELYSNWPVAVFAAGVSAFIGACVIRLVRFWRARRGGAGERRPEGGG